MIHQCVRKNLLLTVPFILVYLFITRALAALCSVGLWYYLPPICFFSFISSLTLEGRVGKFVAAFPFLLVIFTLCILKYNQRWEKSPIALSRTNGESLELEYFINPLKHELGLDQSESDLKVILGKNQSVAIDSKLTNGDCREYLIYDILFESDKSNIKKGVGLRCLGFSKVKEIELPKEQKDLTAFIEEGRYQVYGGLTPLTEGCTLITKTCPSKEELRSLRYEGSMKSDIEASATYFFKKKDCVEEHWLLKQIVFLGSINLVT